MRSARFAAASFFVPKTQKGKTIYEKMTEKLFELAYTDSMTEVQNRNAYEERLKKLRKPQTAL